MDLLSGNQAMQTLENEVPGTTRGLTSGPAVPLREFNLLHTLLQASPRVLSKPQLEAALYPLGEGLESNAIEVHVHHLRRKLGDGVIRTLRGVGYFVPRAEAGE